MIKVSVIIPVYNAEKYLDKCLDSVINQSLKDIEIIIINDGSTDNSIKIINKYLNDKRLVFFNRKNHGIGVTRNFGIKSAKGKYICFLDSDDYYEHNMLEDMYNYIINNDLDIAICNYYKVFDNKKEEVNIKCDNITSIKENNNLLFDINMGPCNKMYNYDLIKDIKFSENLKYEDTPFVAISLFRAKKVGKLDKFLYNYVIHNNSETTVMDERVFDIFKILDLIKEEVDYKCYKDLFVYKIMTYTIQQRFQKNKKLRNKFIEEAFAYLKDNVPDYKKSYYFKKRNIFKKVIEKSKVITKIYCNFYQVLHK